MRCQDMSRSLRAFAGLLEGPRADDVSRFAVVFDGGKAEAVAPRVKRILAAWKASGLRPSHTASLKRDLRAIEMALADSGAKTQAKDYQAALSLFAGPEGGSVDAFLACVLQARDAPPAKSMKAEALPDHELAGRMAEELAATVLDASAFSEVVRRLEDSKTVSAATLGVVANRFLGNAKTYKSRKPAISDIVRRHKDDLRSHARGKALDRIGV